MKAKCIRDCTGGGRQYQKGKIYDIPNDAPWKVHFADVETGEPLEKDFISPVDYPSAMSGPRKAQVKESGKGKK